MDDIILSNPLSAHITVYYLGKTLETGERSKITGELSGLNNKYSHMQINVDKYDYFTRDGKEALFFLSPTETEKLAEINSYLRARYQNTVIDNSFVYVPHFTVFYIKDHELFSKHEEKIQSIVDKNLAEIKKNNVFKSVQLYCVNSDFQPEIQVVESL